jgi:hypothetical protein
MANEQIDWKQLKREEARTISKIAQRAVLMAQSHGVRYEFMDADMDISAAHMSNPMRLGELLGADDGNFAHDVFGIRRHLNRETGKLEDCFSPRFSARVAA